MQDLFCAGCLFPHDSAMTNHYGENGQPTYKDANTIGYKVINIIATVWQQSLYPFGDQAYQYGCQKNPHRTLIKPVCQEKGAEEKNRCMQEMVDPKPKDIIVQHRGQSVQGRPHEHGQKHKIGNSPHFSCFLVGEPKYSIFNLAAAQHLARKASPLFGFAINNGTVFFFYDDKFGKDILTLFMLISIAIVASENIIITIDAHKTMDDKMT